MNGKTIYLISEPIKFDRFIFKKNHRNRGQIDNPSTYIHECSIFLAWYGHFSEKWRGLNYLQNIKNKCK